MRFCVTSYGSIYHASTQSQKRHVTCSRRSRKASSLAHFISTASNITRPVAIHTPIVLWRISCFASAIAPKLDARSQFTQSALYHLLTDQLLNAPPGFWSVKARHRSDTSRTYWVRTNAHVETGPVNSTSVWCCSLLMILCNELCKCRSEFVGSTYPLLSAGSVTKLY
jgi:hypothetical protein